jgi:hypothetical protein
MEARMVVFYAAKLGNDEREWEDAAAGFLGDPHTGRNPRFAVADGATEGFGSARWAHQLAAGFVGLGRFDQPGNGAGPAGRADAPALRPEELRGWLAGAQARWHGDPRMAEAGDLARLKAARVGSFATVLGCELTGLAGPEPHWEAVALGDTVLFHVRGHQLLTWFPRIEAEDFGVNPEGVSTKPERLASAVSRLATDRGSLAVGDRLYLASDALAQWMVRADRRDPWSLWDALAGQVHPAEFRMLAERRRTGEMTNDDVTLLRVELAAAAPSELVVCL